MQSSNPFDQFMMLRFGYSLAVSQWIQPARLVLYCTFVDTLLIRGDSCYV